VVMKAGKAKQISGLPFANQSAFVITRGYDCLKLEGRSLLRTVVSVFHLDWLITSNFLLQVGDNLHTDPHQNSWISTSKNQSGLVLHT